MRTTNNCNGSSTADTVAAVIIICASLSYQWYQGASGDTSTPLPAQSGTSVVVSPTATASYWARVTNPCGSANSSAATVTVYGPPLPPSNFLALSNGSTTSLTWGAASAPA